MPSATLSTGTDLKRPAALFRSTAVAQRGQDGARLKERSLGWNTRARPRFMARRASWLFRHQPALGSSTSPHESIDRRGRMPLALAVSRQPCVLSALTRAEALDVTIARRRAHPLQLPRPNALDRVRTLRPVRPLHHRSIRRPFGVIRRERRHTESAMNSEDLRRKNARLHDMIEQILEMRPELRDGTEAMALTQDLHVEVGAPFLERTRDKLLERARAIVERCPELIHYFDDP